MRILIVSYFFPPYNSIGAVRVGKTAKYLREFGHDVRVVTAKGQPHPPTLPLEIPEDEVHFTNWYNVHRLSLNFSRKTSDLTKAVPTESPVKRGWKSALGSLYRTLVHVPDLQIGWLPHALAAGKRLTDEWNPDLIFASALPYTSLLVAAILSRRSGVPWVGELRDLWTDNTYYSHPRWRRALESRLERRVLSTASGLVTVSDPLAQVLEGKYRKPTATILNGYDAEDYPSLSESEGIGTGESGDILRISYTGRIYDGKRDPSPLFEAIRQLGPDAKKVKVAFYGNNLGGAVEKAKGYGVEEQIEIHDPVPYKESLRIQCLSDILLLLLWNDPKEHGVYTGKLFEYIGARRPILVLGSPDSVASQLVRQKKIGVVLNDPREITGQLRDWIRIKEQTGRIALLTSTDFDGFSRRSQTQELERFLNPICRRHPLEARTVMLSPQPGASLEG
jgi:glycosyltransferase involved in cell wall biosynthesis